MPLKRQESHKLGAMFGKPDIERIGLFAEMAYISGKVPPKAKRIMEQRNLYCEGPKTKNGTQHGYFEPEFKRIFSKEALRGRGRKLPPPKDKNVSTRPFMPPIGHKFHSCPGDYHGTFSGNIEAFSNKRKPVPPHKIELRNCITCPGKKGGPGYAGICLDKYPEHTADRYGAKLKYKEYGKILGRPHVPTHYPQLAFDKNPYKDPETMKPGPTYIKPKDKPVKVIGPGYIVPPGKPKTKGGCQAGCFDKFPEYKPDRYGVKPPLKHEQVFLPLPNVPKSYYNTSILLQNVDVKLNATNIDVFKPNFNKYLVPAS